MPELPEVETVARGLSPLSGRRLRSLAIHDARVWFESEGDPELLDGLILLEVSRRGKYLLLRFEKNLTIVQHLRMTGKMLEANSALIPIAVLEARGQKGKGLQIRCELTFDDGSAVWFFDTRRFGTLTLVKDEELFFANKKIAPDPIYEPSRAYKPIKAALLDQQLVAGVGNIYADEALFAARIHPKKKAKAVKDPAPLWKEILRILHESILQGGSTIRDYVSAEGKEGTFAQAHHVYDRKGEPCTNCETPIKRIVLAGRSTHFCEKCQPLKASAKKVARPKGGNALPRAARKKGKLPARRSRSVGQSRK
jgi:formamidopyrimidine-DNA glycosylase